ncbi:hypothetical protein C1646_713589 [Rhizophagus diaphanus]|nr:hypothetical protein C1646_713589 [Rhizophagus diaphanus] [Rhizophagus sp. MUCL 43196]
MPLIFFLILKPGYSCDIVIPMIFRYNWHRTHRTIVLSYLRTCTLIIPYLFYHIVPYYFTIYSFQLP